MLVTLCVVFVSGLGFWLCRFVCGQKLAAWEIYCFNLKSSDKCNLMHKKELTKSFKQRRSAAFY